MQALVYGCILLITPVCSRILYPFPFTEKDFNGYCIKFVSIALYSSQRGVAALSRGYARAEAKGGFGNWVLGLVRSEVG